MVDTYGEKLYPYLTGSKSDKSSASHNEEIPFYVDVEDYVSKRKGETPNHLEQYLAILYAKNPDKSRHLVLQYYDWYLDKHGLDAKAGTDEALFSTSHWGHFGAARGPILYFALRSVDKEVVKCMVRVWHMMMAAAQLLRTPKWEIVSPGARFFGNANQTKECNRTFEWLATGKTKIPDNFNTSPSYLGLHTLTLIDRDWLKEWLRPLRTEILTPWLPPLKNPLIVHRSESGHVAQFLSTDKMLNPARWAMADYRTGKVVYGLDSSVVERMKEEQRRVEAKGKRKYKLWPDEVDVVIDREPYKCPGVNVKEHRFPVAGGKK